MTLLVWVTMCQQFIRPLQVGQGPCLREGVHRGQNIDRERACEKLRPKAVTAPAPLGPVLWLFLLDRLGRWRRDSRAPSTGGGEHAGVLHGVFARVDPRGEREGFPAARGAPLWRS